METLVDLGLARSIGSYLSDNKYRLILMDIINAGLSNFNVLKTKRIVDIARIFPAVNQVEIHP